MTYSVGPVKITEDGYIAESLAVAMQLHAKKLRVQCALAVAYAFIGAGFYFGGPRELIKVLGLILVALGLLILATWVYVPFSVRSLAKKLARNPLNRSFFGETSYTFREDGLETSCPDGATGFLPWHRIVQARTTKTALVLNPSQVTFYMIPLAQIETDTLNFIRERLAANGVSI